jgi:general secretion pathway protein L
MRQLTQILRLAAVEAGLLAERAWHWWLHEILALVPSRWAGPGALVADMADADFVFAREGRAGALTKAALRDAGGTVSLRLAPEAVLRRTLRLPVSARFRLRDILANDLDRQSPLDPAAVLFTYRILAVERAAARLVVCLVLVRRDLVEAAVAGLRELGFGVTDIRLSDAVHGGEDRLDPPTPAAPRLTRRHRLAAALVALGCLSLAADLGLRIAAQQAAINRLSAAQAQLDAAASRVLDVQAAVRDAQNQAEFLAAQRATPGLGAVLAAVTRLLPDGTWATAISDDGHAVELQGYSTDAAGLVAIFDGSKMFADAAFRAPMTQGPRPDLQQFDLSMNLSAGP